MVLTVVVIVLLIIYGIPLVGKVSSFVSGLKNNGSISTKDITPPAPPNFNSYPDFTNQDRLTISGTAEPGAFVKLTFNSKTEETIVDKDGNFVFQSQNLVEGENTFSAVTKDTSGNLSQTNGPRVVSYDIKPPDLNINSPQDGNTFYGNTQRQINIQGQSEASSSVTINDRVVSLDNSGNFQYPVTLNAGANLYSIKAIDQAGNTTQKDITINFSE